jgi:hypothetical protein
VEETLDAEPRAELDAERHGCPVKIRTLPTWRWREIAGERPAGCNA